MARKKNIKKDNLISWYMEFILENNHQPKSVYSFAKENNFDEADFYKFYSSFETIEEAVFTEFFNRFADTYSRYRRYYW